MRDRLPERHLRLVTGSRTSASEPRTWSEGTAPFDAAAAAPDEPWSSRLTPTCAGFMLAVD